MLDLHDQYELIEEALHDKLDEASFCYEDGGRIERYVDDHKPLMDAIDAGWCDSTRLTALLPDLSAFVADPDGVLACEAGVNAPPFDDALIGVTSFIRGDANADGEVDIADPIWIINGQFRNGPLSPCQDAADANRDNMLDLSDTVFLVAYVFLGGQAPPAPFPACGSDPSSTSESCQSFPPCQ